MGGLCNLEDGGQPFGDPNIADFVPGGKQWFNL